MYSEATVFVVDNDESTRNAVRELADGLGTRCSAYASGMQFLEEYEPLQWGCVVLELRIPDIGGFQIHQRLATGGSEMPVIFLTAHGSIRIAVRVMRGGAFHFFEKPFHEEELWEAIQEAISADKERYHIRLMEQQLQERLALLSPKEQQVLDGIGKGKSVRAIAADLRVSVRTIELRRARVMRKLGFASPIELASLASAGQNGGRILKRLERRFSIV
jgi:FixJ family two-component response regulator